MFPFWDSLAEWAAVRLGHPRPLGHLAVWAVSSLERPLVGASALPARVARLLSPNGDPQCHHPYPCPLQPSSLALATTPFVGGYALAFYKANAAVHACCLLTSTPLLPPLSGVRGMRATSPQDRLDWLTIPDAAIRLSVSEKTVRRMISSGHIRAERFGKRLIRINAESLHGTPIGAGAFE